MHKLRYPTRRVTGASAYSTLKIRLKFKGYSLRNWFKGYQFRPVQRFRCCGHTTPFHDIRCRNHPLAENGWVPIGYTEQGSVFFASKPNTPEPPFMRDTIETKSIEIKGFQVNPDNLKYLTGGYLNGDLAQRFSERGRRMIQDRLNGPDIDQTRDDLDPIPPEFREQAARFMDENDEALRRMTDDPAPPEFPPGPPYNNDALNRWADIRRKAHPDAE